jgi:hypothetical protein
VITVPEQPLPLELMVKVTVTGAPLVLISAPLIFPDPLAGIPVICAVLFLDQLNVVPATLLVIMMGVIADPEQLVCEAGVATDDGFTTTVAVIGVPVQPFAVGVMVKVTVSGDVVEFVSAPVILPEPLASMPVTVAVLFLVQL